MATFASFRAGLYSAGDCWVDRGCVLEMTKHSNQKPRIAMPIVNRVADLQPDIQAWRRDIHEHPELLYEVHRTAALVADLRSSWPAGVASEEARTGRMTSPVV